MYSDEDWGDSYEEGADDIDEEEPQQRRKKGILFPATYFNNKVFEEVLPRLGWKSSKPVNESIHSGPYQMFVPRTNKPHRQIVYTALYSACFHKQKKMARLSLMDIARRTGIDWRTVKSDLFWLGHLGLIKVEKEGRSKSRKSRGKTLWSVPLANFDMEKQHFTPVPKFIIENYVPAYPRAIVLPVLQYIRQWRSRDDYWVTNVGKITGWPLRTNYRALKVLGDYHEWNKQIDADDEDDFALPYPIEVKAQKFNLRYLDFRGHLKRSISLTPEFQKLFFPNSADD